MTSLTSPGKQSFPDRIAGGCCQPQASSEPCVTVSRHTAQASRKANSGGAARHVSDLGTRLCDTHMQSSPCRGDHYT
jgi:hypothetical protein